VYAYALALNEVLQKPLDRARARVPCKSADQGSGGDAVRMLPDFGFQAVCQIAGQIFWHDFCSVGKK
jgi:hypothetical protein